MKTIFKSIPRLSSHLEAYAGALMENASDAIFVLSLDGEMIGVNRQAENLLGFSREYLLGKPYLDCVVRDDHEFAISSVGKVMEGNPAAHNEVRLRKADGGIVTVDFSAILIDLGDEKVLMGIGRDITDQKRAEEDRARLAAIVEFSNDAICGMDLKGKVHFWNSAAEKLFGYSSQEMEGHHIFTIVPANLHFEILQMMEACKEGGTIKHFETVRKNRRQEFFPVSISWSPLRDKDGQVTGISAIVRDLTEQKRVEDSLREQEAKLREAQKMEVIGRLAGGAAHDFNNVLNAILLVSDSLAGELNDHEGLEDLMEIQKNVRFGTALTQQLLAFSHKQEVEFKILDLNSLLLDFERMLKRIAGNRVELDFQPGKELNPIYADSIQVKQIVMNLVMNACDAMPGGGKVVIQTGRGDREAAEGDAAPAADFVWFSVKDTGTGIDLETQKHIFEPFFTTKPLGKGTGLGLSIVRDIVRKLGGSFRVKSQMGLGSEFMIIFPAMAPNRMLMGFSADSGV